MRDITPVPTSLFRFSISKDEYDSLICIFSIMCDQLAMLGMKTTNEQGDISLVRAIKH